MRQTEWPSDCIWKRRNPRLLWARRTPPCPEAKAHPVRKGLRVQDRGRARFREGLVVQASSSDRRRTRGGRGWRARIGKAVQRHSWGGDKRARTSTRKHPRAHKAHTTRTHNARHTRATRHTRTNTARTRAAHAGDDRWKIGVLSKQGDSPNASRSQTGQFFSVGQCSRLFASD